MGKGHSLFCCTTIKHRHWYVLISVYLPDKNKIDIINFMIEWVEGGGRKTSIFPHAKMSASYLEKAFSKTSAFFYESYSLVKIKIRQYDLFETWGHTRAFRK